MAPMDGAGHPRRPKRAAQLQGQGLPGVDRKQQIVKPGQAGQIPVRAAGAGGQDGKGAGRVVLQKLFQGFLLQLIILQQVNVNAQIRPLRYHALDVDAGKALRPGLDGEGPGNFKSTGSLHLPDAPGSFAEPSYPTLMPKVFSVCRSQVRRARSSSW